MTDSLARGFESLDTVVSPLGWDDILERIEQGPSLVGPSALDSGPGYRGRGWWMLAAIVLVVMGVIGVVAINYQQPLRRIYHSVTGSDPTDEGYLSPYRAAHLREWVKDYDPAEIDYLKSTGAYTPSLEETVTTMEFRRACRETARAQTVARAASPQDRSAAIDEIMAPEIARLTDRNNERDESAKMFGVLSDRLKAGDDAWVTDWLSGPHGNCQHALAYGN